MADIFISYKRTERSRCVLIHDKLNELGFSVWFDAFIESGVEWSKEIDREADAARCVLALLSPDSLTSFWVRSEILTGIRKKNLAAAFIERTELPTTLQAIEVDDLSDFTGDSSHPGWIDVVNRVSALCGRPALPRFARLLAAGNVNGAAEWAIENYADPIADRAVEWSAEELQRRTATMIAERRRQSGLPPAQRRPDDQGGAEPASAEEEAFWADEEQAVWREEDEHWHRIEDSEDYRDFMTHLRRFPNGRHADEAKRRAADLEA